MGQVVMKQKAKIKYLGNSLIITVSPVMRAFLDIDGGCDIIIEHSISKKKQKYVAIFKDEGDD
ncbi:MAG: hypothetical protein ACOC5T_07695 [Elusimicrobiota bacterium]